MDVLPQDVAESYATEDGGVLAPPLPPLSRIAQRVLGVRAPRAKVFGSTVEYHRLLRRMVAAGMLSWTRKPRCVNGIFAVPKGPGEQRLIIDARAANALFVEPPRVVLPTPDVMVQLRAEPGVPLFVAKCDLSDYYHQLLLPEWLRPFFALPAVPAHVLGDECVRACGEQDVLVYPCCTTVPMGWSHSVWVAQRAHEHVIDTKTAMQPADRITPDTDVRLDRTRHGVYIDDVFWLGHDQQSVDQQQREYIGAMTAARLPPKPKKTVTATADGVECIGIHVDGRERSMALSADRMDALRTSTAALLHVGECTGMQLARVVGQWTWAALVRRCSLSVLSSVYRFIERAGHRRWCLWPSVRDELSVMMGIAPLLRAELDTPDASLTIATDASSTGFGVVTTRDEVRAAPRDPSFVPSVVGADVQDARWSTALAGAWRRQEHINALELRAVETGVRWAVMAAPERVMRRRVTLLVDSTVAHGVLSKGRSSSQPLLRRARAVAATALAADLHVQPLYVPTLLNPADEPSRRC